MGLLLLMVWVTACNDSDDPELAGLIATNGLATNGLATAAMPEMSIDTTPEKTAPETTADTTPPPSTTQSTSTNQSTTVATPARRPCVLSGDNWAGVFYNTVTGGQETITAQVSFGAEGITILTSKRSPPGQSFRGTVNNVCSITVIDDFDGEDWTTKFGGADDTQLRLADWVIDEDDPAPGTNKPPLNVIELFR